MLPRNSFHESIHRAWAHPASWSAGTASQVFDFDRVLAGGPWEEENWTVCLEVFAVAVPAR